MVRRGLRDKAVDCKESGIIKCFLDFAYIGELFFALQEGGENVGVSCYYKFWFSWAIGRMVFFVRQVVSF